MKLPIRQEIAFILLCSRTELDDETEIQAKVLIDTPFFDWEYFYNASLNFGVLPLLYGHLKNKFKAAIPEPIYKKINHFFMVNAAKNMVLTNELLKILDLLQTRNILAMPFKGPVLADMVYGSDVLRIFSDIDIFVQESEAVKARDILQEYGYQLAHEWDKKYDDFYVGVEHAFNIQSPDRKINIDLQWKLLGIYTPEPITLEKFKDRLITIKFGGKDILQLSYEDLLFYLCVHGTKDGWKKFEWICCISEILRNHPDLKWDQMIETAKEECCLKKFKLGLYLAYSLCKAPLPDFFKTEIKKDKSLILISKQFEEQFFSNKMLIPDFTNNPRFSPFHIHIQDDLKNKLKYILRQLFRPTTKEILLWSIPGKLNFLYYIFRPIRLLWRIVSYYFHRY